jgi:D-threo-aldose 1-dehydrogenase
VKSARVKPGLSLSELGFSGAQVGNLFQATTDKEAGDAVAAAWGAGTAISTRHRS